MLDPDRGHDEAGIVKRAKVVIKVGYKAIAQSLFVLITSILVNEVDMN